MIDLPIRSPEVRLDALRATGLLDAPPSAPFDRVTALAQRLLDAPVSLVSLVDRDRQFFLSAAGLGGPWAEARQTPLSHSFCQHVVEREGPVRVENAPEDPAFCDNLAIRDLDVIGYLGVPVRSPDGAVLGSLCAITPAPRAWTDDDLATLKELAAIVEAEVALEDAHREAAAEADERREAVEELQVALDAAHLGRWEIDLATGLVTQDVRARGIHGLASDPGPVAWAAAVATIHPDDRDDAVAAYRAVIDAGVGARFAREYRVVGPEGSVRWIRAAGQVRAGARGDRLVGVAWDVTDEREAERALAESEERYRTLFESVDVGFCIFDMVYERGVAVDYRFVSVNPAFVEQTGLEDAEGKTAYELVPNLEAHWVETYARVAETGEPVRFESGSEAMGRWFDVYGVRIGGAESRRVALLFTDVTRQREAARELQASRDRLELAIGAARLGTFEYALASGRMACDDRTQEILDLDAEASFEAFLPRVLVEDRPVVREHVEALEADPTSGPFRFRYRTRVHGEVGHVAASIRGVAGPDGGLATIIGAVQDVTDWVEAEAAARESGTRLDLALSAAGLGTWDWDATTGRVVFDERWATMLGYDPAALAPHTSTWERLVHPDDFPGARAALEAHLAGDLPIYEAEFRMRTADGGWRWILSRGQVFAHDDAGRPVRVVGLHHDVTDRVRATDELERRVVERTAELERSNAELDQFAYVASHDLKAPIRAIDSLAAWIAEDAGPGLPEGSARHLALLRSRAARMEGLLDSLLTYSRVGRTETEPEPLASGAVVRDAVEMVAPPEGFDVRLEGDFPVVVAARAPFELVFRNLVGNAIKHHDRPDGRVTVSAEAADGWATFTVADDGPGIDPAYQDRIFGLFQTLRPRDEVEGSGMGLSIVKKAVESRGGTVAVASDGRGTAFRVRWPLASDPPSP